jgi:fatty-acyl-CoA synthase
MRCSAESGIPPTVRSTVSNVGAWLPHWAARRPGKLAVDDGERRLDYRALEERSARLAGWLRRAGVGPGERVGILLGNRSAYFEALFAAARVGAVSLPINTRLSPREVRFLLEDAAPAALLYEHELAQTVDRAGAARRPGLRIAVGGDPDAYEQGLAASPPAPEVAPVLPEDPVMLMYTSGTTGEPKGALLPHRKTLANSLNAQLYFAIRPDDRVLVAAPLFHSLGLLILSLPVLYAGASLFLQPRFRPEDFWRAVARERITYSGGVPTMYQRLHDALADPDVGTFDLSSLRFLFTAGAAAPVDLVRAYDERGQILIQGYGQTETSILCCLDAANALRKAGSVGRPVFHAEVRCVQVESLDEPPEKWRDAAPGETGEVVVRGPVLMLGYWGRPEETARTIREGWLRTGDLASVDAEGFYTLSGRARDMWISGGENVYPAEVEAVFAEHPAVREIAVIGVPDREWGEVGRAFVVIEAGQPLDREALLAWGRERLAAFKLPRSFVAVESLPKTASGKVQKHQLLDQG